MPNLDNQRTLLIPIFGHKNAAHPRSIFPITNRSVNPRLCFIIFHQIVRRVLTTTWFFVQRKFLYFSSYVKSFDRIFSRKFHPTFPRTNFVQRKFIVFNTTNDPLLLIEITFPRKFFVAFVRGRKILLLSRRQTRVVSDISRWRESDRATILVLFDSRV